VSERPLVTIVTPSFNQAAFLEEAIESVLAQDYEPLEYIVVDGGSTDGSVDIIRRYEDRLAWWTSGPDGGQAAALNDAFAKANGKLVGWLNSDDTLLPGSVTRVAAALTEDPEALFAYGDALYTDAHSQQTGYFKSSDLDVVEMVRSCTDEINPQGALFRRRALELGSPLEGFYCWDFELVLRLGLAGHAIRIDEPVATFRIHEDSKSVGSSPSRRAEDYLRMYDRFFAQPDLPEAVRAVEPESRASVSTWAGELFYAAGEHRRARECFRRAFGYDRRSRAISLLLRATLPASLAQSLRALRAR
jgi:glycosyltransferase involved in cell wall biosynthesis